jgi:glycosyltransferase involved in cell wall biosynthesis
VRALIFIKEDRDALLAGRTERSMRAAGLTVDSRVARSLTELAAIMSEVDEPLLAVRSGAWLAGPPMSSAADDDCKARGGADWLRFCSPWHLSIPASATGRPLVALGVQRAWMSGDADFPRQRSRSFWRGTGGDLERASWRWWSDFEEPLSLYLEPACAHALARRVHNGASLASATESIVRDARFRAVHIAELDVHHEPSMRIVQLVTSIQIGGAERVALDLAEELNFLGHTALVAAFGAAYRKTFPKPWLFCDLSRVANCATARGQAIARLAADFGADAVHAHLIRADDARAIRDHRIPLVITMHNLPPSWPAGFSLADPERCDLILACSKAVERAVVATDPRVPVRTVWNGIDGRKFAASSQQQDGGRQLRAQRGWNDSDFVIVAVANPRTQKRLERLPQIIRHVADQLAPRKVRLLWVGDAGALNAEAATAVRALQQQIIRWLASSDVHCAGALDDVRPALAAADVFLSASAYEGLSIAQLEALAARLPVVATAVGGAPEIADFSTRVTLLPEDAPAEAFAERLTEIARHGNVRASALPVSFTRHVMARRTAQFCAAAIGRSQRKAKQSVWLITNNFSTGGAQASARRLLVGLHQRGVPVSAFTIQEQPRWPTPGRRALHAAGVRCHAIAPPKNLDANEAVERVLEYARSEMPATVLFWNVIASHKILLADLLIDTAIYDVSPGEMFFNSLNAYFENPRAGIPYANAEEYGRRLAGVIVKYRAEKARAAQVLGTAVNVIPNGVPLRSPARGGNGKTLVFGTAARLSPDKRLEDLIEAWRIAAPRLPPHVLRVAGGPENSDRGYMKRLHRLAGGLPIEWLGELSDLTAFYDSLDVFVMMSEPAGCPNVSLEAMAAGLPVIATDHGGASEQVIDRLIGRLVPRFAVEAFSDAVVELAQDRELRRVCGRRAREHVGDHFSLERMIDSYAALCVGGEAPRDVPAPDTGELCDAGRMSMR